MQGINKLLIDKKEEIITPLQFPGSSQDFFSNIQNFRNDQQKEFSWVIFANTNTAH